MLLMEFIAIFVSSSVENDAMIVPEKMQQLLICSVSSADINTRISVRKKKNESGVKRVKVGSNKIYQSMTHPDVRPKYLEKET